MGRPRQLRPGLSRRGDTYVSNWRDASGQVFRRKAGTTIDEAIAFKTRIDAELNAGAFVPAGASRSPSTPPTRSRRTRSRSRPGPLGRRAQRLGTCLGVAAAGSERGMYSTNAWHDLTTEQQVRLLLQDMRLDLVRRPALRAPEKRPRPPRPNRTES